MKTYRFTVTSTQPLIMDNWKPLLLPDNKRITPRIMAEAGVYRLEPEERKKLGQLCLPSSAFYKAMRMVIAKGCFLRGRQYHEAFAKNVHVRPEKNALIDPNNVMQIYRYSIYRDKGETATVHPQIMRWTTSFDVFIEDGRAISRQVLSEIVAIAGKDIGIGAFTDRNFGHFRTLLVENEDDIAASHW